VVYDTAQIALNNTATATSVTVRALGSPCATPPKVSLLVDNHPLFTTNVTQATWADYSTNVAIPPGSHTVAFQYRSSGGRGCTLRVDRATFAFD
jgi:hypothetical protein